MTPPVFEQVQNSPRVEKDELKRNWSGMVEIVTELELGGRGWNDTGLGKHERNRERTIRITSRYDHEHSPQ